ncbi:MAG: YfhO family protein [Ruminococcus sp.]|nr:YfhO family protein [Ruminococcus sp.]
MKRLDRFDVMILAACGALFAAAVLIYSRDALFGSTLDWASQHYVIPDSFRRLFYETGELFPSFMPNLGGGENIYYLSYYGLYSPVIMLSCLLPFVPMAVYIEVSSAVLCYAGAALFYRFTRKRYGRGLSLVLMLAYLCAGPVFLHSHRHIMFVNFLPFLILSFEAVDSFFEGRRKWQLILFPLLMILTGWYFAAAGLTAVTVYGIYRFLSVTDKVTLRGFLNAAGSFALRLIAAVMTAGVLILPTVYVILSGRDSSNTSFPAEALIPAPRLESFAYTSYSMGLGAAALFAVIAAIVSKDRARRFLGTAVLLPVCCPVILYILNGTQYIDAKVLIPFIPLTLLLCGELISGLGEGSLRIAAIPLAAAAFVLCFVMKQYSPIRSYMLRWDIGLTAAAVLLWYLFRERRGFCAALLIVPCFFAFYLNQNDSLITKEAVGAVTSEDYADLSETVRDDPQLWRSAVAEHHLTASDTVLSGTYYSPYLYSSLHNKDYNRFYFDAMHNENEYRNSALTTRSQNPLFEMFMSVGYLYSESGEAPFGYTEAAGSGSHTLYRSQYALPIGRCKPALGCDVFGKLSPPEQAEALLYRTVTGTGGEYRSSVCELGTLTLPQSEQLTPDGEGYKINSRSAFTLTLPLEADLDGKLIFIEFGCSNKEGTRADVNIGINGVSNCLTAPDWKYYNGNETFTYVLYPPKSGQLCMTFEDGEYSIGSIRAYTLDFPSDACRCDGLVTDSKPDGSSVLSGRINVTEDGVFELAVPYDDGFTLIIDGAETEPIRVSTAFIGAEMSRGEHTVELRFRAPWLTAGIMLSAAGLLLSVILTVRDNKHKGEKS